MLARLSGAALNELANVSLLLGLTISLFVHAGQFVIVQTLIILCPCLGLLAFIFDTIGGELFANCSIYLKSLGSIL